jgi:uracil-DNA glycosylase
MLVAFGQPAAKRLMPHLKSTEHTANKRFDYLGIPGVTAIHPAILLRVKGAKAQDAARDVDMGFAKILELYTWLKTQTQSKIN